MLFERIESKGLAHYSYLIGDGNEAIVIDPRRDCNIYVEKAAQEGYRIAHVLETHRNEDYVIGSMELAARTDRMNEVPKDRSVYVFCGSGLRSMIGASLLQCQGWHDLTVVLGGLAGWSSISCPIAFGK